MLHTSMVWLILPSLRKQP
uniref:Uncharacterized protein n=1 Tax=Arundo donax TaxID=35708 RepID=A0A0A9GLL2_ARUDO